MTERTTIATLKAPRAIGPYSQAILAGNTLYISGQLGMSPQSGEMVMDGIRAETRQALENIKAILEEAGFGLEHVVQTQVFLADICEFAAMNEVYGSYFASSPPARVTVQAAALPRGGRVEITAVAVR